MRISAGLSAAPAWLELLRLGTFTGPTGTFRQVTDLTKSQIDLLSKLRIDHPKKIIDLQTAPR